MNGALPRARLKQLLASRAPGADAAALERQFAAALRAARLPDKPAYRPAEVAAIGQALMALAVEQVSEGLAQLQAIAAETEPAGQAPAAPDDAPGPGGSTGPA
jgi:hypothetical protein